MKIIPIRASSLPDLFDCPARWEAKYILGMRLPKSSAAQLGTAVHASTGVFDQSRLDGNPVTADEAAGALVDAIQRPQEDVSWGDDTPREAERIGLSLHAKYCAQVAPAHTYRGVEVSCDSLEITDLGLALTGTTDRVRETPKGLGISDLKTGRMAVSADGVAVTKGHALQMGVYELLAEHALGLPIEAPAEIIGMQTAKTTQRIGVGEIANARAVLIGTEERPGMLQHAAKILHDGTFFGNSRSVLCSEKFCPRYRVCRYRG